jgi:hypothetical protein
VFQREGVGRSVGPDGFVVQHVQSVRQQDGLSVATEAVTSVCATLFAVVADQER